MARRFGFPGAYAAYNAGPERYARHVRGAASLPAETRAYMASLSEGAPAPMVRGDGARPAKPRWQEAGLFLGAVRPSAAPMRATPRSEEHTSELQSLMRISYAVFCLKKKKRKSKHRLHHI